MTDHDPNSNGAALTAESDVLAFFYADAVGALSRIRDDAEALASFAARIGSLTLEAGIAATSEHRAEFHVMRRVSERFAAVTYRIIATLEAVD